MRSHSQPRLRILQLVQQPLRRGGEIFAAQLSRELREVGHTCKTAYLYDSPMGPDRLTPQSGDVVLMGDPRSRLETTLGFHPRTLERLRRAVCEFSPDLLQLNGARAVKYGAVLRRLGASPPTVYRNIGDPRAWLKDPKRRLFYEHVVFPGIDGVAAIGEAVAGHLRGLFRSETSIRVIPSGVEAAHLEGADNASSLRDELDTPSDARVVLFVGRLSPEKRLDRLLKAIASLDPRLVTWLVGDGPEAESLAEQAEQLELNNVRFCGARSNVGDFYRAADAAVLTSDTEGVPAVLLEAGYCGTPVVATRVGAIAETVRHGVDGFLVEPTVAGVANGLRQMLRDEGTRRSMGTAFRERVMESYTLPIIAAQFEKLYQELHGNR